MILSRAATKFARPATISTDTDRLGNLLGGRANALAEMSDFFAFVDVSFQSGEIPAVIGVNV